ncbi:glutamyl-tRNA reductase [Roseofilum casamattae]|uniref:Glutamyl-tRNA reductase n=1 Tax=Roseofilum casamattae BLCC-M143 TaxID=3022442 RepID=A0ABT7C0R6_9CYAN|nr:glutamyl-tRNA reductase [Roseofilum casamattae]MDJ1185034.1 glutamyl-tRNA reductase [Roseofilum casamattae BLCC-M143]
MNVAVIGLSHKTAPVEVREKLSIPEPQLESAMTTLKLYPHIEEVAILSTCNRLEIYAIASDNQQGVWEVNQFLSEHSQLPLGQLRPHLFILLHEDAISHLLRVAAGLDSLVLGEGQILSQVKQAHKLGQQYKGVGRVLNRLLKQAITAGKRVRTETNIGTGAVSISSAAVELAQMKLETLEGCKIAIIGAGKMSRLLVQHLLSKGGTDITIVNRSMQRAKDLAGKFSDADLTLCPIDEMLEVVGRSDLVFTSTGATQPLLDLANLEAIVNPERPLTLVDISVPRNVAADASELSAVRSYNVDDLKAVVAQNQESRRQIAMEAESLLEEEVEAFEVWWRSLETVPTINCLRNKVETIREQELEKALSRLGSEFAEKHQETIEALTRGIVNKILHDPMVQLRAQQDIEARKQAMETLKTLFNLDLEAARN